VFAFGDDLHRRGWPLATWLICCLAIASLVATMLLPELRWPINMTFGFIPVEFSVHPALNSYRFFTAEFVHQNLTHLLGNLLFLLAFGRAVEGLVGSIVFAAVFVSLGALSFLGSWLISPASTIPIIGNSGAVSFLLGGYVLIFPKAKIRLLPFLRWPYLRAWSFAAAWLTLQIFDVISVGEAGSGVAYWTHFAGFAIGLVAAACWREFALDTERIISEIRGAST
jgi:membrane associated rhomboid family serine protease